jgi:hypothetical protein
VNVVNLDASIENRMVFGRSRCGRHDLDVMTSIGQDLCQVPDMDLLPANYWWVELREHQDAHSTVRSLVARGWSMQAPQRMRTAGCALRFRVRHWAVAARCSSVLADELGIRSICVTNGPITKKV